MKKKKWIIAGFVLIVLVLIAIGIYFGGSDYSAGTKSPAASTGPSRKLASPRARMFKAAF